MMFVLLSHFSFTYFSRQQDATPTTLRLIGMVASPTFVLINGILIGFLCRTRTSQLIRLRTMYIDRGLLLLTVGHLLLVGSHIAYTERFFSITDTVGVCMLLGPWIATRLSVRARLALGASAFAMSWIAVEWWHPTSIAAETIKEAVFGTLTTSTVYVYAFPVLPWLSLDIVGSVLGSRLGDLHLEDDTEAEQRLLTRTSILSLTSAAVISAVFHLAKYAFHSNPLVLAFHPIASPFGKQPPSLVYLLFYGGIGVGLLSASLHLVRRAHHTPLLSLATALGRTSFVVFMLQFYVYLLGIAVVRPFLPYDFLWPLYFALSVVMIVVPALAWHRRGYNRFLTIGYRHLAASTRDVHAGRHRIAVAGPAATVR